MAGTVVSGCAGLHSTNGVAALHSELLQQRVVPDFVVLFPERFNNKTNGVTPRRWLLLANPSLAVVITDAIGDGWITDLAQLEKLKPLADDKAFCAAVANAKRQAKLRFIECLGRPGTNPASLRPSSMRSCNTATTTGIWPTSPVTPRSINGWGGYMPTSRHGHAR
jgi:starch phosphorylase